MVRKMNPHSEENKVPKKQKKGGGGGNHKTKSLVLLLGLGSEDRHAIHLRQLESYLSCPCWIWGDTR